MSNGIIKVLPVLAIAIFLVYLQRWSEETSGGVRLESQSPLNQVGPFPGQTNENLWYFVQITDTHISHVHLNRNKDFLQLSNETMRIIKPKLVLVSGDITDSKTTDNTASRQYAEEWESYGKAAQASGIDWIDLRGNHDCYQVPNYRHHFNFFRKHSPTGVAEQNDQPSMSRDVVTSFGRYRFVLFDACPDVGSAPSLNFFGRLTQKQLDKIESMLQQPTDSPLNHTLLIGHYPIGAILSDQSST